jgi:hypothetical protein
VFRHLHVRNRYSTVSLAGATGHAVYEIAVVAFNQEHATAVFLSVKDTLSSRDSYVGFEDRTAVVMELPVFWGITPRGPLKDN